MLILKCKLVKFLILATTQAMSRHYWSLLATFILILRTLLYYFRMLLGSPKLLRLGRLDSLLISV